MIMPADVSVSPTRRKQVLRVLFISLLLDLVQLHLLAGMFVDC
jgi:hypothetical protein